MILSSILLRAGVGEAFIRFYFDDTDPARRDRIARTATATVAWTTTVAALAAAAFAGPLSRLILNFHDPELIYCAALGLWAFTNLEMAYAQLRVDERSRTYVIASGANVSMTVVLHDRAGGVRRQRRERAAARELRGLGDRRARALVGAAPALFTARDPGGPAGDARDSGCRRCRRTPACTRCRSSTACTCSAPSRRPPPGQYAIAVKLATVVFVAVRGFQYAWPPLAYSIESDEEAGRVYSLVTTYYVLATGVVVCGVALLSRWMVRLLAAPQYFGAYRALPWLALGWALYGLFLVFVAITGRARITSRNFPAAAVGLAVNVALILLLVPGSGAGLGIAGAGIALCGAYAAMLAMMYLFTRRLFRVGFEWGRLGAAGACSSRSPSRVSCCSRAAARSGCSPASRGWASRPRCCC